WVGHREPVDPHAGDGGVDQLDVDIRHAQLLAHQVACLAQRPSLHDLEGLLELGLVDLHRGIGARHGHRGAEALDLLAGDPDHALARDGVAHVLCPGDRFLAALDDALDVRRHAGLHVGADLALAGGAQHDAVLPIPADHQRLDVLGADVECRVEVGILGPPPDPLQPGAQTQGHQPAPTRARTYSCTPRNPSATRVGSMPPPWPTGPRPPPLPTAAFTTAFTPSLDGNRSAVVGPHFTAKVRPAPP